MNEYLGLGVLIAAALLVLRLAPAHSLAHEPIVRSHPYVETLRTTDEAVSYLEVPASEHAQRFDLAADGSMHEPLGQRSGATFRQSLALIAPGLDLGTWAGYSRAGHGELGIGARVSPVRLLFGAVSPDLLISQHGAGVGLSVYPPVGPFSPLWNHLGVGVGRTWPYRGGSSSDAIFLTFSTLPNR